MKTSTKNIATGIASITGLIGFAYLLMLFGETKNWVSKQYEITVRANQASGVRSGSPVTLAGVPIGEVVDVVIQLDDKEHPEHPARITAKINNGIEIPKDTVAAVITSLIGSSSQLNLSVPAGYQANGQSLAKNGTGSIEAIFESDKDLVIRKIDEGLKDFSKVMISAQAWLGDEQIRQDFKSTFARGNELVHTAQSSLSELSQTMATIRGESQEVVVKLTAVMDRLTPPLDQLSQTLEQIKSFVKVAQTGDGTIGQLMTNPDLYKSLVDSMKKAEHAIGEFDQLMEKIRVEGIEIKGSVK